MEQYDDEEIVATQEEISGDRATELIGKTKLSFINKREAPLTKTDFNVLLELTGGPTTKHRAGLDLVAVLDVSGSMSKESRLEKMVLAMKFLIKKLSPIDRLSIVQFHSESRRLCKLRQMTEEAQAEMETLVDRLVADYTTNIAAGLEKGLEVVKYRKFTDRRVAAIMLMSDGIQDKTTDAARVPIGNVPVYTFGISRSFDPVVLKAIADNSNGGTMSAVQNSDELSIAFSQCLAGLLTVVVQDLTLTVGTEDCESTLEKVSAGSYPKSEDMTSVTVVFGNLYAEEIRKVLVNLTLDDVKGPQGSDVLKITYTYRAAGGGTLFEAPPLFVTVSRVTTTSEDEKQDVLNEIKRIQTAEAMNEARIMADNNNLKGARETIQKAENALRKDVVDELNPAIEMLIRELQQIFEFMATPEIYKQLGRAFLLAALTAHDRQRQASKGDMKTPDAYATSRMKEYLKQVLVYMDEPSKPVPSAKDDVEKEIAADPLAPIVGPLTYHVQNALDAIKSIEKILGNRRV